MLGFCKFFQCRFYYKLVKVASSFQNVKNWSAEFKHGRDSLEDDARERGPKTETFDENIDKVHNMILDDRRFKMCVTAKALSISEEYPATAIFHQDKASVQKDA